MPRPDQVAELLIDVEAHLRQLGLWQEQSPPEEAFESTQPFFIDTLSFDQWLQFVFLPTMYQLIEDNAAFPTECAIAPMAEEFFRGSALASRGLEVTLAQVDRLLTQG
ncbi:MAG: YqcC family protein [Pseudomonadota bacterium]